MWTLVLVLVLSVSGFPASANPADPQQFLRTCSGKWSNSRAEGPITISVTKIDGSTVSGTVDMEVLGRSNSRPVKFSGAIRENGVLVFGIYNSRGTYVTFEIAIADGGGFVGSATGVMLNSLTLNECST